MKTTMQTEAHAGNSTYPIDRVCCLADSIFIARSLYFRNQVCSEKPTQCKCANRYAKFISSSSILYYMNRQRGKTHFNFKKVIVFLIVFGFSSHVLAQKRLQVGPVLGFGFSSLNRDRQNFSKLHLKTGVVGNYSFNDKFNLQPSLLISTKGQNSDLFHPKKSVALTYGDVNLTLKYKPWNILFIGLGIQAGWLISAKYEYLAYGTDYYDRIDISGVVNNFDYGMIGNLGCQFKNGIGMEISITYGFKDVFNGESTDFYDSTYNTTIQIDENLKGQNTVISTAIYYLIGRKK